MELDELGMDRFDDVLDLMIESVRKQRDADERCGRQPRNTLRLVRRDVARA